MENARMMKLETLVAELNRTVEELSGVVASQASEIDALNRRVTMLMEREAGRELDEGGSVPLADQRPPHW